MAISVDGANAAKKSMLFIVLHRLFPIAPMQTIKSMADAIKERVAGMTFMQMQKAIKEVFSQYNVSDEEIVRIAEAIFDEIKENEADTDLDNTNKFEVGNADLDEYRAELKVPDKDTIAVAKTDVKGLEGLIFKGASPEVIKEAQKAGVDIKHLDEEYPNRSIKAPWDTRRRGYGQFTRHAEEVIMAQFEDAVNKAGLSPDEVKGTIYIHQSNKNGVCPMCTKGLFEDAEPKGIFKQFTEKYPNLNIVVTSDTRAGESNGIGYLTFNVKNGKVSNWTKKIGVK